MADNVDVTAGSGTKVGTDERTIAGTAVHVQRVAPHGAPNWASGQVAVSTAATAICAEDTTRMSVTIVNRELAAVYLGSTTAVSTASFRLDPGDSVTIATGGAVYGVTAAAYTVTGDAAVHYLTVQD